MLLLLQKRLLWAGLAFVHGLKPELLSSVPASQFAADQVLRNVSFIPEEERIACRFPGLRRSHHEAEINLTNGNCKCLYGFKLTGHFGSQKFEKILRGKQQTGQVQLVLQAFVNYRQAAEMLLSRCFIQPPEALTLCRSPWFCFLLPSGFQSLSSW